MTNLLNWIKQNKLATFLVVVVVFLLLRSNESALPVPTSDQMLNFAPTEMAVNGSAGLGAPAPALKSMPSYSQPAPTTGVANRLVVSWSTLSLQVSNVTKSLADIKTYAESLGGYMVSSSTSNPQKVASGDITIRVPSAKLDETLVHLRGLAVQVVSEELTGQDVTDQYTDVATRLAILEKTKARFDELATKAVTFSDVLEANQQIIAIQDQIDALKGQQNYLTKTAEMAKVTVYLSTDEFSLPYSPAEPWRADVIFKEAVRSLVADGRKIGTALIWLAVYSVIIIPAGLIIFGIYKFLHRKPS